MADAPTPLIDLDEIATLFGMPPAVARAYLEGHKDCPVATYRGRPLWLSATVHDAVAEGPG